VGSRVAAESKHRVQPFWVQQQKEVKSTVDKQPPGKPSKELGTEPGPRVNCAPLRILRTEWALFLTFPWTSLVSNTPWNKARQEVVFLLSR
jgi:hypothetical protein